IARSRWRVEPAGPGELRSRSPSCMLARTHLRFASSAASRWPRATSGRDCAASEAASSHRYCATSRERGAAEPRRNALRHLDRASPILLLLVDLEQMQARRRGLLAVLELAEDFLGAVENSRLQVVLAELRHGHNFLLRGKIGPLQQVLVHADRPVVLAGGAEKAAADQRR